jgi:glycerophosphoryl diester phosphodiesterase
LFGWGDGRLETAVARCIQEHRLEDQVIVSSFNPLAIRRIRPYLTSQTKVAHLWDNKWFKYKVIIAAAEANHPHYELVNEKYMHWAHKHNWLVNVWTVDDLEEAKRLTALGVDAIITNTPQRICQAIR